MVKFRLFYDLGQKMKSKTIHLVFFPSLFSTGSSNRNLLQGIIFESISRWSRDL